MLRSLSTAFAAAILSAGISARAAQIVTVPVNDPKAAHAQIVAAATKACREAIGQDDVGDFGPLDDCVRASVANAKHVPAVHVANAARSPN